MQKTVLFIVTTLLLNACSTLRLNHYADVTVNCEPDNATARVNAERKSAPAVFTVPRDKNIQVFCEKEGYETAQKEVQTRLNATGWLDTIAGYIFLVPYIGVLTPGAWSLEEEDISLQLQKLNPSYTQAN